MVPLIAFSLQGHQVQVDVLVPTLPHTTEAQLQARATNLKDVQTLTKGLLHRVVVLPSPLDLLAHVKVRRGCTLEVCGVVCKYLAECLWKGLCASSGMVCGLVAKQFY